MHPGGGAQAVPAQAVGEARRILEAAERQGVLLRLLGGTAILIRCPSASTPTFQRARAPDIDLAGRKKDAAAIKEVFAAVGYESNDHFNAVHGYKQLMFQGPDGGPKVDVFLDEFSMCHRLDLRPRLSQAAVTLPLADLLFTKLQIVQINEKDLKDITALLLDHEVVEGESADGIDGSYLADLAGSDWGIYTTLADNLAKVRDFVPSLNLPAADASRVLGRIERVQGLLDAVPKSVAWRLRARVGRRVAWYDLPDEPKTIVLGAGKGP